ncbi:MAG: hypothetical protein K6C36_00285 [Clostridia bacterium]|nr:hypothetical protein [Clostridia bacterium]
MKNTDKRSRFFDSFRHGGLKAPLCVLLACLMIAGLVSCASKPDGPGDDDPTVDEGEWEIDEDFSSPEDLAISSAIDTELDSYSYKYHRYDGDSEPEGYIVGCGVTDADMQFTVFEELTLRPRGSDIPLFSVVIQTLISTPYTTGVSSFLCGELGGNIYFYIQGDENTYPAYYLFSAETGAVTPVGMYEYHKFLGERILLKKPAEDEAESSGLEVRDFGGELLHSYDSVRDVDVYDGFMFMLSGEEETVLSRVPFEPFFEDGSDLSDTALCSFGDYSVEFSQTEYNLLSLTRRDYRDWRTCTFAEAPALMAELAEKPAEGHEDIVESCGAFSVTLPGMFAGRYNVVSRQDSLMFFQKASNDENEYEGFMFGFSLVELGSAADVSGNGYVLCRYVSPSSEKYVAVTIAEDFVGNYDYSDEFRALYSRADDVTESIAALGTGASLEAFDYSSLTGRTWSCKTEDGGVYELFVSGARGCFVSVNIYYTAKGASGPDSAQGTVMLLDVGYLYWIASDYTNGSGTLRFTDEGVYLEMKGQYEGWTNTGGEILLSEGALKGV